MFFLIMCHSIDVTEITRLDVFKYFNFKKILKCKVMYVNKERHTVNNTEIY